jgi:hypothetical protein
MSYLTGQLTEVYFLASVNSLIWGLVNFAIALNIG